MNKQEKLIVGLLFGLLVLWGMTSQKKQAGRPPPKAAATAGATQEVAQASADTNGVLVAETAIAVPEEMLAPERTLVLSNDLTVVVVTSRGGAITEAELPGFRASLDKSSGPVRLDFATRPALAIQGIPGLDRVGDFMLEPSGPDGLVARARTESGIELQRTIRLVDGYRLTVEDVFANPGMESVNLPAHAVSVGPMHMNAGESHIQGMVYLGLDTLAAQGDNEVEHWGKTVNEILGVSGGGFGCSRPNLQNVPVMGQRDLQVQTDWVAAKNKFFVQILAPEVPAQDCRLHVEREAVDTTLTVKSVAAELLFGGRALAPGETWTRRAVYYVGPKEYSRLKTLGKHQHDVMQFGWFEWFRAICAALLYTLNAIYRVIPNYGVAVILVTVLVRAIFWPITHKSMMSMKKMQKIQPLVTVVREKHKSNPQKMNQEIMLLYREHKVNPLSGCLPMLVQIPVFIALYNVLRSAVELRYAEFLWIKDLSEPENLLHGMIPLVGSLNILPLFMTATTVLQQKLTPATMDPQQQKIMTYMPIMFLFFFYTMPSALVLYWTVSQLLAIAQIKWNQRGDKATSAGPVMPVPVVKGKR